jgi:hypothetical protein
MVSSSPVYCLYSACTPIYLIRHGMKNLPLRGTNFAIFISYHQQYQQAVVRTSGIDTCAFNRFRKLTNFCHPQFCTDLDHERCCRVCMGLFMSPIQLDGGVSHNSCTNLGSSGNCAHKLMKKL